MTSDTAEAVLARERCPACAERVVPSDIVGNHLVVHCPRCPWFVRAVLPALRKQVVYLDTSTLSHIAKAVARGEDSRWVDLGKALKRAVDANVIACPSSPVIDDEAQLSHEVSRSVRELSRSLGGDVRLRHPATVQERQLVRAFRRFLSRDKPMTEHEPPFSDISDDDPNTWLSVLQIGSLVHKTPPELSKSRVSKVALCDHVTRIFETYSAQRLTFEQIRQREAAGFGAAVRRTGPLWPFLMMAREVAREEQEAWNIVDSFLKSSHAALVPAADVTSRLYAVVATAYRNPKGARLPGGGDADDIQQIATYLPYVDVLIADRFFGNAAVEPRAGLGVYRGRVQRLGGKHVSDFIEWIDSLVFNAPHASFADRLYEELSKHGSFRRFTNRMGWTDPESDAEV